MPTYDYECEACGHAFEKFQSITAKPVRTCPSCGKRKVRRLLGMGAALIFKGSGFHATDYRSASYKSDAKKAQGAAGDGKDADKACKKEEAKACAGCKKASKTCPSDG